MLSPNVSKGTMKQVECTDLHKNTSPSYYFCPTDHYPLLISEHFSILPNPSVAVATLRSVDLKLHSQDGGSIQTNTCMYYSYCSRNSCLTNPQLLDLSMCVHQAVSISLYYITSVFVLRGQQKKLLPVDLQRSLPPCLTAHHPILKSRSFTSSACLSYKMQEIHPYFHADLQG